MLQVFGGKGGVVWLECKARSKSANKSTLAIEGDRNLPPAQSKLARQLPL